MHEYGLCRRVVSIAAERAGGGRVAAVDLVVGDMSGCVADCMALYFDILAEGTVCEGAALRIERVAPMLRCGTCGGLFERKPFAFDCPCGGQGLPTDIGREFYVRSIELVGEDDG